ncbi:DUF4880 domain-containing protein [Verticiella sediminum]|uniref:DUF4880 domain-containing protein n=1 Tax=Verticiella sediminum TaxID=1247510 RepID=A0A556ABE4_9BURK|nr:FecR domain-containing protein [Verticiella sediminum]TSH90226.1 DUF4880 domain-containing protein [Verticiella sediminum]
MADHAALAEPVAEAVVDQAVDWYVRLAAGTPSAREQADFESWRSASPEHDLAWQRLRAMGSMMQGGSAALDPALARGTLNRASALARRRGALKLLLLAAGSGSLLTLGVREHDMLRTQLAVLTADLRTGTGELRSLMLPDGTRLQLNTATAVNVVFGADTRRIELLEGEIMLTTGTDRAGRPFVVATREGELMPIGTRYGVWRGPSAGSDYGSTGLAVLEGEVQVHHRLSKATQRLRAGQQTRFDATGSGAVQALNEARMSWAAGRLTATGMRLADFAAELARYRSGWVRCDPEVADLRITGVWPLDGVHATDPILASLERHLPVRVLRSTRYWVTLTAA